MMPLTFFAHKLRSSLGPKNVTKRRYLSCPAAVTVGHLQKFVRHKFGLAANYQVDIIYCDEVLESDSTLIDVAYIYRWKRNTLTVLDGVPFSKSPMQLSYLIKVPSKPNGPKCAVKINKKESDDVKPSCNVKNVLCNKPLQKRPPDGKLMMGPPAELLPKRSRMSNIKTVKDENNKNRPNPVKSLAPKPPFCLPTMKMESKPVQSRLPESKESAKQNKPIDIKYREIKQPSQNHKSVAGAEDGKKFVSATNKCHTSELFQKIPMKELLQEASKKILLPKLHMKISNKVVYPTTSPKSSSSQPEVKPATSTTPNNEIKPTKVNPVNNYAAKEKIITSTTDERKTASKKEKLMKNATKFSMTVTEVHSKKVEGAVKCPATNRRSSKHLKFRRKRK
ncbi:Polycomb complex protein BMI-1-B [Nymphon striatum]|nr:Polycomb complex protein BMI-1-B [Nymphon striatum]